MNAEHILIENDLDPDHIDVQEVLICLAQGKLNEAVTCIAEGAGCSTRQATRTARMLSHALKQGQI